MMFLLSRGPFIVKFPTSDKRGYPLSHLPFKFFLNFRARKSRSSMMDVYLKVSSRPTHNPYKVLSTPWPRPHVQLSTARAAPSRGQSPTEWACFVPAFQFTVETTLLYELFIPQGETHGPHSAPQFQLSQHIFSARSSQHAF